MLILKFSILYNTSNRSSIDNERMIRESSEEIFANMNNYFDEKNSWLITQFLFVPRDGNLLRQ